MKYKLYVHGLCENRGEKYLIDIGHTRYLLVFFLLMDFLIENKKVTPYGIFCVKHLLP